MSVIQIWSNLDLIFDDFRNFLIDMYLYMFGILLIWYFGGYFLSKFLNVVKGGKLNV